MRPAKTYRQATEGKDIYGPGIGSELSQKCLHSLCLTSKRIGAITTPELYANLQGATGRFHSNGIERLVKYTKMILNKPILRNHLVYIKHLVIGVMDMACGPTLAIKKAASGPIIARHSSLQRPRFGRSISYRFGLNCFGYTQSKPRLCFCWHLHPTSRTSSWTSSMQHYLRSWLCLTWTIFRRIHKTVSFMASYD
jgi:hypothetical protein